MKNLKVRQFAVGTAAGFLVTLGVLSAGSVTSQDTAPAGPALRVGNITLTVTQVEPQEDGTVQVLFRAENASAEEETVAFTAGLEVTDFALAMSRVPVPAEAEIQPVPEQEISFDVPGGGATDRIIVFGPAGTAKTSYIYTIYARSGDEKVQLFSRGAEMDQFVVTTDSVEPR